LATPDHDDSSYFSLFAQIVADAMSAVLDLEKVLALPVAFLHVNSDTVSMLLPGTLLKGSCCEKRYGWV